MAKQREKMGGELIDRSSSGRKRPWSQHKRQARAIAASLWRTYNKNPRANADLGRRSDRIHGCGNMLTFGDKLNCDTGEVNRRLVGAMFCKDRLCPLCAWRKSLVMFNQMLELTSTIQQREPDLVPIFLTLTVRNCESDELADTLTALTRGWSAMFTSRGRRRPWRIAAGWFRAVEITYNKKEGTWHPHIHALVYVQRRYFEDPELYMDHDAWMAEWREVMRLDYDPWVDVRAVRPDDQKGLAGAVAEVAKYAVKPGEWVDLDDEEGTDARVALLATVMRRRRMTAFGGIMKEVRAALKHKDVDDADLINTDDEFIPGGEVTIKLYRYAYDLKTRRYILVAIEDLLADGKADGGKEAVPDGAPPGEEAREAA